MRRLLKFKCKACGWTDDEFGDCGIGESIEGPCPLCNSGPRQRIVSFAFHRGMPEHYNMAVGKHVSNSRHFSDELKRKSEELTIRTGMDYDYQPVDYRDKDACGATDEGLDSTYRRLHNTGESPSKTTTII